MLFCQRTYKAKAVFIDSNIGILIVSFVIIEKKDVLIYSSTTILASLESN